MKRNGLFLLIISILVVFGTSCKKDGETPNTSGTVVAKPTSSKELTVSRNFKFATVTDLPITITALDNQNAPLANVRINILTDYRLKGGLAILSASTDQNGVISLSYNLPDYLDSVVVATNYIGLPNETKVSIKSGLINLKLGGMYPVTKSAIANPFYKTVSALNIQHPLGGWDSDGVPTYLEATNDVVDANLLNSINNLLPEQVDLRIKHPELLSTASQSDLVLTDVSDVWVTFIGENAGFLNTLGYYYYPTNNPPTTAADIAALNIIFPNSSLPGSGGNLHSGNKVKLKGPLPNGSFPANTTVGWVLFANGYSGNDVTSGNWVLYSDWKFNPETDDNLKKHFLFLNDRFRNKFLLSVEDWRADESSCDHDFNDCVYYVTVSPYEHVNLDKVLPVVYDGSDVDGDGVPDSFDDYPSDPNKAYNSYYPSKGTYGSVAFEDLWPYAGDYDLNDMVIDCNFNQVSNASNNVVEIDGQISLRAMGAGFNNGFGFQLPFPASSVSKCTVINKRTGLPVTLANTISIDPVTGLEKNQDKAVVILSEHGFNLLPSKGTGIGTNTTPGIAWAKPDTLLVTIILKTPIPLATIGNAPYNPFIFVDGVRGREVHLPDMAPTNLADMSLFGTGDDNSTPATGRYYRLKNNMPWAISFADHYDYPIEKSDIINTHLHFAEWVLSGGATFKDWYLNKTGYRNNALIYQKP